MNIKIQKQDKTVQDIKKTRRNIEKIDINNRQQQGLMENIRSKGKMADPFTFVEQKNTYKELETCIKNWDRKIEIAEVAAKRARIVIRQNGGYIPYGNQMQYDMM